MAARLGHARPPSPEPPSKPGREAGTARADRTRLTRRHHIQTRAPRHEQGPAAFLRTNPERTRAGPGHQTSQRAASGSERHVACAHALFQAPRIRGLERSSWFERCTRSLTLGVRWAQAVVDQHVARCSLHTLHIDPPPVVGRSGLALRVCGMMLAEMVEEIAERPRELQRE